MSTIEEQIAKKAKDHRGEALTNLHGYINEQLMFKQLNSMNRKSASGVDKQSWELYNQESYRKIKQLHKAFKSGNYRAPNIRRVYIPKGDGSEKRPLGLPTIEDKLLQGVVSKVLQPVYELEFYDNSYGFRPRKSAHQALEELFKGVTYTGSYYIIDADIKDYFGSINHQCLREFLDLRIKDGVIRKQIDKWLKAGILEDGQVIYPKSGTPQGGSISPLLSNIYLHYVLDEWFIEQIQPLLRGKSKLIRYADDFVIMFTDKLEAERVLKVLPKRMGKYGLTLHPEKTRLIELTGEKGDDTTFDFLGFTHYLGKSRKGNMVLMRKTSRKKLRVALIRMNVWIRVNRHVDTRILIGDINDKLRGYYNYYGITFNNRRLKHYYHQVSRMLFKWLNRRGGKRINWERYYQLITEWLPLLKPKIYHSYL